MVQIGPQLRRREKIQLLATPENQHLAHFYSQEWMLTAYLQEYVSVGLRRGETCIVIATPDVLIRLQKGLRTLGMDVARLLAEGDYLAYDAEAMLDDLLHERTIDEVTFNQMVGGLIGEKSTGSHHVRIYAELVPQLIRDHNIAAAMVLENLWEHLRRIYDFSLYCSYAESSLMADGAAPLMDAITHCHTRSLHSCVL